MARLWTAGAELQTVTAAIEFTAITTNAPAVETTTKRSGNAAWRISNAAGVEGFRQAHTSAQGSFFFRFYLYIVAMPTNTRFIGGYTVTGTYKVGLRLTSGGNLQLYNFEDSAQIGSNSSALSTATWYRIEMSCDSTTLSATAVDARIDGASFASGTADLTANPTSVRCGTDAADATLDYIVDDLAVNDSSGSFQNSWCGEGEVIVLRPNGNGDNSAWTGSDGDSTDNYLLIEEVPPDTADYVQSNTLNQIDDYNLEATPAAMDSNDTINVVHVGVLAAVSDATSADPDIVLRIKASASGTVEESASLDCNSATFQGPAPLPADSNYKLTLYDLPGASTTAWTKADLDTAQAGVREAASDTHFARIAALWVMVDHKPTAGGTEYPQSASGSITPSGATLKDAGKIVAGGITPSGATLKSAGKVVSGSLTPAGALLNNAAKVLSGALTPIGSLTKTAGKVLAGGITPSGALESIRTFLKELAGSITPSGAITRSTAKAVDGSVTPSGVIARAVSKAVAGALTPAGSIIRSIGKLLSGLLTPSGTASGEKEGAVTTPGEWRTYKAEKLKTYRAQRIETFYPEPYDEA